MEIHLQYIQIDYFTYGFVVDNDRNSDLHVLIVFSSTLVVIVVRCDDFKYYRDGRILRREFNEIIFQISLEIIWLF